MWLIASIPFWLIGGLFTLGAIAAVPCRKPQETAANVVMQITFALLISGASFIIAAKIAS